MAHDLVMCRKHVIFLMKESPSDLLTASGPQRVQGLSQGSQIGGGHVQQDGIGSGLTHGLQSGESLLITQQCVHVIGRLGSTCKGKVKSTENASISNKLTKRQ
jgi:hypothetical protein